MSKQQQSSRGFLTHAQWRETSSSEGESERKEREVHTQSHACAVCLSLQKLLHLFRKPHAFLSTTKGRMVSGTRLVTGTVRDARSCASWPRFNSEHYRTACSGFSPNGLHWVTTTSQWFATIPCVFFLLLFFLLPILWDLVCKHFLFAREETDIANSSVWSGSRSSQYGPGNQTFMGGKFTRKCTRGENHWALQAVSANHDVHDACYLCIRLYSYVKCVAYVCVL